MAWMPHEPVMLREVLEALRVRPGGAYLDATAGGGGHAAEVLERLGDDGRLVLLDRDPEALTRLEERFGGDPRVSIVRAVFRDLLRQPYVTSAGPFDGILFDFGVSSHQIDDPSRGFSFSGQGPLDMRMGDDTSRTAAEVVNDTSEAELARIIREYGEEKAARRIAREIVARRPLSTTGELAAAVSAAIAGPKAVKSRARVFQAIRIEVNAELTAIDEALPAALELLAVGGRLVTLAYHSLEDRRVKEFIRGHGPKPVDPLLPPTAEEEEPPRLKEVVKGAGKPSEEELQRNPRARSARMRVAEKRH